MNKVVYVGNVGSKSSNFTLNKIYEIEDYFVFSVVDDDNGDLCLYEPYKFIPLNKWREQKINKILKNE